MASENAKAVAKEVSDTIRKGKKVVLGEIIRKHGYSPETSKNPQRVTKTKSYKKVMAPVVNNMVKVRDSAIEALSGKDLSKEKVVALSILVKNLTHDIQLLNGGATDRVSISDLLDGLEQE